MNIGKTIQPLIGTKTRRIAVKHYMLSVFIIGGTVALCIPLSEFQGYHVVSYILLSVVSILATFMGIGPVFMASALSALVWNFFFIPPNYTFHIEKAEDILMFGMFFVIALLNGIFTTRVRRQEQLAREREIRTNALFQLTRELSKASGIDEVLAVSILEIKNHFSVNSLFILQDGNNKLYQSGRLQSEKSLTQDQYSVADWVFRNSQKAGKFTENFSNISTTFFPLPGTKIIPGVVSIELENYFALDQKVFWDTCITLISNALEREFLEELAQKARFLDESDRLYKTLFNSISHELRIPVATIMGASDTLINSSHPGNIQSALCSEIFTASIRLNRLIENLLNMSRLESGRISIRLDWHEINDLINKVIEDLQNELKPFSLKIIIPENMPLVKIDFGLIEQVIYNLLYNATQYAPVASEIKLITSHEGGYLSIIVSDEGPGFPPEMMGNVFKKFFRVNSSKTGGLGLGLSIAKGFIEAHKGHITVKNNIGGGAMFCISIPSINPDINKFEIENP